MPTRRDFLAGAASSGLLAAIPLDRSLALHAGERPGSPNFALDDTDLTWVPKLRGKSRAVFDSPQHGEGGALFRAAMWRQQINKAFGTPLDRRVWEAMGQAHETDALRSSDFPKDVVGLVAETARDPVLNPRTEARFKATRTPLTCGSASRQ